MAEEWMAALDGSLTSLSAGIRLKPPKDQTSLARTVAQYFLLLWIRLAVDLGRKFELRPGAFDLGLYEGQNVWKLNDDFDFSALSSLTLSGAAPRYHALKAEFFTQQGTTHLRLLFALEEMRMGGEVIPMHYLVYEKPISEFDPSEAFARAKAGLEKWFEAHLAGDHRILWDYCQEHYEKLGF